MTVSKQINKLDSKGYPFRCRWTPLYVTMTSAGNLTVIDENNVTPSYVNISPTFPLSIPGIDSQYAGVGFTFRFADVINAGDFQPLYDGYRFGQFRVKIDLMTDYLTASNATQRALIPEVYIVNDYDDGAYLLSPDVALQYNNCRIKRLTSQSPGVLTKFIPHPASNYFKTSGSTIAYGRVKKNPILDMSFEDVEHYGFKLVFNNMLGNLQGAPVIRLMIEADSFLTNTR